MAHSSARFYTFLPLLFDVFLINIKQLNGVKNGGKDSFKLSIIIEKHF